MILTKENIEEWKKELDIEFSRQADMLNLSETLSDEEWLDMWEECSTQEAIDSEIDAMKY